MSRMRCKDTKTLKPKAASGSQNVGNVGIETNHPGELYKDHSNL